MFILIVHYIISSNPLCNHEKSHLYDEIWCDHVVMLVFFFVVVVMLLQVTYTGTLLLGL